MMNPFNRASPAMYNCDEALSRPCRAASRQLVHYSSCKACLIMQLDVTLN